MYESEVPRGEVSEVELARIRSVEINREIAASNRAQGLGVPYMPPRGMLLSVEIANLKIQAHNMTDNVEKDPSPYFGV